MHVFSFLDNDDYGKISRVSKLFSRLSLPAFWENIYSLDEQKEFELFAKLCLKVNDLNKKNIDKTEANLYIEQLEKYLRKPLKSIETAAVASTALTILNIKTAATPDKMQACEYQLRFILQLLGYNKNLPRFILLLIEKSQGFFINYVTDHEPLDSSFKCIEKPTVDDKTSLLAYKISQEDNIDALLLQINHFWHNRQPIEVAKKIKILWPTLKAQKQHELLFCFFEFIERTRTDFRYKLDTAAVFASMPNLSMEQHTLVFYRCLSWLAIQPILAVEFLKLRWASSSETEQNTAFEALKLHLGNNKLELCRQHL